MKNKQEVSWAITDIHVMPSHLGMKNFVRDVEYIVTVNDGEHKATIGGKVGFPLPEKRIKGYKRFDRLTSAEVIRWVKEAAGEQQVLSGLMANLERQKKPETVSLSLSK